MARWQSLRADLQPANDRATSFIGATKIRGVKAAVGVAEGVMQPDCMADERTAPQAGSVLQLEAGLLGISPMIRRRIPVPGTMSLHGLHGALQVAMGWEGIHLFEFNIRGVVHAGPCLPGPAGVDTPMSKSGAHLMLRTGSRVPDGTLKARFRSWHPGLFNAANKDREIERAAA